jgi:hypothetical protein
MVIIGLLVVSLSFLAWFFVSVFTPQRSFEVIYEPTSRGVVTDSDTIAFEASQTTGESASSSPELPPVVIVNESGVPEAGARLAVVLTELGYVVAGVRTELDTEKGRTVIVYADDLADEALALSARLNNALLSAVEPDATATSSLTVYLGRDVAATFIE